jgi:transposase
MPSYEPIVRRLAVQARRAGLPVKEITEVLSVCRNFVWEWSKRAFHQGTESFKDFPKTPKKIKRKVTEDVENAVLALRTAFKWGSARIRVVLENTPPYLKKFLADFGYSSDSIVLSRTTINNVLKKHGKNGSPYGKTHEWKFNHATAPNELWQIDLKGPVNTEGKRKFILVAVDDYSRYDVALQVFQKDPSTQDVVNALTQAFQQYGKPQRVLTDNGGQFKEEWKRLVKEHGSETVFAHPYYPQDKGKVEREIRNVSEEVIRVAKVLKQPLEVILLQYREWRNNFRFHYGIKDFPARRYVANVP